MRLTGFAGYYRKGAIVRSETGEDMRLPFGYKDLGAVKQPLEAVFGVETVPVVLRIEVMGTDNPFRRNQVLSLPDGIPTGRRITRFREQTGSKRRFGRR